ncbi:MAG: hypothetical protein M1829_002709 [Trizodia sp. TS-e1964]|nr:MAG: hypothetical protein M1829_002709 [Trizodia sp. TS-e1964]
MHKASSSASTASSGTSSFFKTGSLFGSRTSTAPAPSTASSLSSTARNTNTQNFIGPKTLAAHSAHSTSITSLTAARSRASTTSPAKNQLHRSNTGPSGSPLPAHIPVSGVPARLPLPSRSTSGASRKESTRRLKTPKSSSPPFQPVTNAAERPRPNDCQYSPNCSADKMMLNSSARRAELADRNRPPTSHAEHPPYPAYSSGGIPGIPEPVSAITNTSIQSPSMVYQHIHDMASKRISTLDYLRKAHDGRVYWFNTLLFSKPELAKMSYFDPKKLSRRAANFLLLGLSLPAILDLNSQSALEYLRSLNALLLEFENYQQAHPPDGSTSSSLSRARIPQMFKRATHSAGSKSRRSSSAAEIGLPMGNSSESVGGKYGNGGIITASSSLQSAFPPSEQELLPGEEYMLLLTPSLPFDPDFYETFATLCDVLIDCYTRITGLINDPMVCGPGVGEMFAKADARIRKVIVVGVVKEFEDASRSGAKVEVASVAKVVLGGLM